MQMLYIDLCSRYPSVFRGMKTMPIVCQQFCNNLSSSNIYKGLLYLDCFNFYVP